MPTYKDLKTGLWYCKFVFTDWSGNKKQKKKMGFKLQKEAKTYEIEFLSKAHVSCDMSFSSIVELYMEDCKARLKPTTYAGKEFLINAHLLPFFTSNADQHNNGDYNPKMANGVNLQPEQLQWNVRE